jgi:hypothetical protein
MLSFAQFPFFVKKPNFSGRLLAAPKSWVQGKKHLFAAGLIRGKN